MDHGNLYCTSQLHQSQERSNSLTAERHSLHIPTLKFLVSSLKVVCSGKIIREKLGLWHGALTFYKFWKSCYFARGQSRPYMTSFVAHRFNVPKVEPILEP
jgi:hypothetical protein